MENKLQAVNRSSIREYVCKACAFKYFNKILISKCNSESWLPRQPVEDGNTFVLISLPNDQYEFPLT